jgi:hypothetical protein
VLYKFYATLVGWPAGLFFFFLPFSLPGLLFSQKGESYKILYGVSTHKENKIWGEKQFGGPTKLGKQVVMCPTCRHGPQ